MPNLPIIQMNGDGDGDSCTHLSPWQKHRCNTRTCPPPEKSPEFHDLREVAGKISCYHTSGLKSSLGRDCRVISGLQAWSEVEVLRFFTVDALLHRVKQRSIHVFWQALAARTGIRTALSMIASVDSFGVIVKILSDRKKYAIDTNQRSEVPSLIYPSLCTGSATSRLNSH